MTNKSVRMTRRSRLAVVVSLGLAVAAAACGDGANSATSPSGVSPSSLAANGGQSTRDFSVTVTPASVQVGAATLHVTVTRDVTSGQSQKLGSVEIYVPSGFTIQSVTNISNATGRAAFRARRSGLVLKPETTSWTAPQDGPASRSTSTSRRPSAARTRSLRHRPRMRPITDPFDPNWTYTGSALSVTVTNCVPVVPQECKAAPAVANDYLESIDFGGGHGGIKRGDIINSVAHHMTQGARFDGIDPCDVEAYRAAVIAFVIPLLPV